MNSEWPVSIRETERERAGIILVQVKKERKQREEESWLLHDQPPTIKREGKKTERAGGPFVVLMVWFSALRFSLPLFRVALDLVPLIWMINHISKSILSYVQFASSNQLSQSFKSISHWIWFDSPSICRSRNFDTRFSKVTTMVRVVGKQR